MSNSILIVRDNGVPYPLIGQHLLQHNFRLLLISFGDEVLTFTRKQDPDILLLDIDLPTEKWFDLCRTLRESTRAPIILIAPKSAPIDRIRALEIGADDCMVKPIRAEELLMLLRAHLQRANFFKRFITPTGGFGHNHPGAENGVPLSMQTASNGTTATLQQIGSVLIDLETRKIQRSGVWYSLKPMEFALLLFFVRNQGVTFSRPELLGAVWGKHDADKSRTVDVHIRWLRKKVEDDPTRPRRILTVRGMGYRFNG